MVEHGVGERREGRADAAVVVHHAAGEAAVPAGLAGEDLHLRPEFEAQVRGRESGGQPAAVEDAGARGDLDQMEWERLELRRSQGREPGRPREDVDGPLRRRGPAVDLQVHACIRDVDRDPAVDVGHRPAAADLERTGRLAPGGNQRYAVLEEPEVRSARDEAQADARGAGRSVARPRPCSLLAVLGGSAFAAPDRFDRVRLLIGGRRLAPRRAPTGRARITARALHREHEGDE